MINALLAVDPWGGMGIDGTLPWPHNQADMANFARLTKNQVVIMGRRTWDDPKMPKPLRDRTVYVATNRPVFYAAAIQGNICEEVQNLASRYPHKTLWVIGGAQLIEECIPILDRIHLTYMADSYKVDTKIHVKQLLTDFAPVEASYTPGHNCTFVTYARIPNRTKSSTN